MDLQTLLNRLNARIADHNAKVEKAVEDGKIAPGDVLALKLRPGIATAELVGRESWPLDFSDAVGHLHIRESPVEILRLEKPAGPTTSMRAVVVEQVHGAVIR